MDTPVEQLPLGSSSEIPEADISYIGSIIRITRTDDCIGTAQEKDGNLQYRIELLAPSTGLFALCLPALLSCLMI